MTSLMIAPHPKMTVANPFKLAPKKAIGGALLSAKTPFPKFRLPAGIPLETHGFCNLYLNY